MAVFKVTALFQFNSAISTPNSPSHRISGWSESWYFTTSTALLALQAATQVNPANPFGSTWMPARAALLPVGASIIGQRVTQVSPTPGPTLVTQQQFPGLFGQEGDVPQNALLIRVPASGANNVKRFSMRNVPDINITEGEYTPATAYATQVTVFGSSLTGWQFRGRDLTQAVNKVVSIVTTGGVTTITTENAVSYSQFQFLRVLRSKDSSSRLRGARVQVTANSTGNTTTISGWPFGNTVGGSVRLDLVAFPTVDATNFLPQRLVSKKVGRPFFLFRGRRSARH